MTCGRRQFVIYRAPSISIFEATNTPYEGMHLVLDIGQELLRYISADTLQARSGVWVPDWYYRNRHTTYLYDAALPDTDPYHTGQGWVGVTAGPSGAITTDSINTTTFFSQINPDQAYLRINPAGFNVGPICYFTDALAASVPAVTNDGLWTPHFDAHGYAMSLRYSESNLPGNLHWDIPQTNSPINLGGDTFNKLMVIVDPNDRVVKAYYYDTGELLQAGNFVDFPASPSDRLLVGQFSTLGKGEMRVRGFPAIACFVA